MSDRSDRNDSGAGAGIALAGFFVGAIVGAGVALLLAPVPGGETRRKLSETAKKLGSRAGDIIGHGHDGPGTDGASEAASSRTGGRREPLGNRMPQSGTQGTQS